MDDYKCSECDSMVLASWGVNWSRQTKCKRCKQREYNARRNPEMSSTQIMRGKTVEQIRLDNNARTRRWRHDNPEDNAARKREERARAKVRAEEAEIEKRKRLPSW